MPVMVPRTGSWAKDGMEKQKTVNPIPKAMVSFRSIACLSLMSHEIPSTRRSDSFR